MVKLEKALGILVIIGLALKFSLPTGANILLTTSFSILASLYFSLGFALFNQLEFNQIFKRNTYKRISTFQITGAIIIGFAPRYP
jgi:hypothetical protein